MENKDSGWGNSEKLIAVLPYILSIVAHRENNIFVATKQLLAGDDQLRSSSHSWLCLVTQELRQSETQAHTCNSFFNMDRETLV